MFGTYPECPFRALWNRLYRFPKAQPHTL